MYTIEPISSEYIGSFREALDLVARERKYLAAYEAPPLESCRAFVQDHIDNKVPHFIAFAENRVVGWCDISLNWRPVFAHCGYLGMGIVKEFRGQGIGNALLDTAIRAAKARGLQRIELEVFKSNIVATRLYRKFGFVEEGVKVRGAKVEGRFENVIVMGLLL